MRASAVGEVIPGNEFYDYEAKYTEGKMAFTIPAPGRGPAHRAGAGARGGGVPRRSTRAASRAATSSSDTADQVILNEINTIPGMTAMSGFPRLWAASGVDGKALVEEIVRLGLERHERLARLKMAR